MTDHDDHDHEINARTLTLDQLADALRTQARGSYSHEASVELLIDHGGWLRRNDFLDRIDIQVSFDRCALFASVDWDAVGDAYLPASDSETQILDIVAELAGHDSGRPLANLVTGLDATNIARVIHAVLSANGRPVSFANHLADRYR
jgi:hypothetical protein